MGMEKYECFVRRAANTLTYDPGWSCDNRTGSWRTARPVLNAQQCNECGLCWLFCPDGCFDPETFAINYVYCKGCGICAVECPRNAIEMEREG